MCVGVRVCDLITVPGISSSIVDSPFCNGWHNNSTSKIYIFHSLQDNSVQTIKLAFRIFHVVFSCPPSAVSLHPCYETNTMNVFVSVIEQASTHHMQYIFIEPMTWIWFFYRPSSTQTKIPYFIGSENVCKALCFQQLYTRICSNNNCKYNAHTISDRYAN